jgi:hypothetical protein
MAVELFFEVFFFKHLKKSGNEQPDRVSAFSAETRARPNENNAFSCYERFSILFLVLLKKI